MTGQNEGGLEVLKPCPFCGGAVREPIDYSNRTGCVDAGCPGYQVIAEPAAWNRRALTAHTEGEVVWEARLLDDGEGWWSRNNDPTDHWGEERFPTHWRPMPAPPTATLSPTEAP